MVARPLIRAHWAKAVFLQPLSLPLIYRKTFLERTLDRTPYVVFAFKNAVAIN